MRHIKDKHIKHLKMIVLVGIIIGVTLCSTSKVLATETPIPFFSRPQCECS